MAKPRSRKKTKLPPYVVIKNKDQWHVRLSFPTGERDAKGHIVYLQVTRRCEPQTAERAAEIVAGIQREVQDVQTFSDKTPTIAEYLSRYLEVKKASVTPRTLEGYEYLRVRYIDGHAFGRKLVTEITAAEIQRYYDSLLRDGVSATMVRKTHALLTMMFNQAVLWEDLERSPGRGVMVPRSEPKESKAFTADEAKRFVAACQSDDKYLIFEFGLVTGLRPQELVAVRWSDINMEKLTVSVRQAAAFSRGGQKSMKAPKTRGSVRTVSFTSHVRDRLIKHKAMRDQIIADLRARIERPVALKHKNARGVNYKRRLSVRRCATDKLNEILSNDLVFPAETGGLQALNNLGRRHFKDVLKLAGLDSDFSIKNLRHTNASMLAEKISPRKLQQHLGHRKIETTLRWYVHVDDDSQFEASDRMGEMLY